jgi:hypothetical protein
MKLNTLVETLNCEVFNPEVCKQEKLIEYAFCADLMSDALMLIRRAVDEAGEMGLLITGLATNQSIRTAEMLDIDIVVLVRGKKPTQAMIDLATDSEILLLGTNLGMYTSSGFLFTAGLKGIEQCTADGVCNILR